MPRRASLLTAAALLAVPPAGAAPPPESPRVVIASPARSAGPATLAAGSQPAARSMPVISLSVKDADLVEVVRSLRAHRRRQPDLRSGVSGTVTAELTSRALGSRARGDPQDEGLAMELDGRILTVAQPAGCELRSDPPDGEELVMSRRSATSVLLVVLVATLAPGPPAAAQRTAKPPLHGRHWIAITGKPLAATAGAMMFEQGGNAVDAACAMIAATATMFDAFSWGGEVQALVFDPAHRQGDRRQRARRRRPPAPPPSSSSPRACRSRPSSVRSRRSRPGAPGGLMVMLAEFGKLSLAEVLAPAIDMADGYPDRDGSHGSIEREKKRIAEWPYSKARAAAARGRGLGGAARRRDVPPARPRRHAAQAGRGRARRRSPPARAARTRSWPRTTASTAATSRASSCAARASRAASTPRRTSPAGRSTSKSR